jgi:HAD superfamily hydrolase (TIGR01509 family)
MPIARSLFFEAKKLRVFDFDDTLVQTTSHIYVTHKDGKESKLTPGQYAIYKEKPGDKFDFRDFESVINPIEIKAITKVLRDMLKGSGERGVFILTARSAWKPIKNYLKDIGIRGVHVIALASNNPKDKSDWIEQQIDSEGYDDIYFIDDSKKNVDAVKSMLQSKGVKHRVQHMKHKK